MIKKIGVQLFTIRDYMKTADDMLKAFKRLKEIGYDEGQTAGIAEGMTYYDMADIAKEAGIEIVGTHYSFDEMLDNFDETVLVHKALGTTNCGVGGGGGRHMDGTPEGLKAYINAVNNLADRLFDEHGMKFTYHNHSWEFERVDGNKSYWDIMVEEFNPDKVSFVLDTCWVAHAGADVRYWIEKLAGRIDILHLKDKGFTINNEGEKEISVCEIGQGNLWWDGIMESAEKSGVKHYCVEQDCFFKNNDPFESLKISADYLKKYM